ncbi:TetR/AcrR family transcriptional regulator [Streptomyces sp. L2]|uniref:TetR/AcrR family transcriptional regulator n=1 Tax=Streptomyces sp. L2 TaxID=2162665 RepID=UPI00101048C4|nr:TetR/AcrR family transcriptional regulator [Streptomyces sp. L2]
MTEQPTDQAAPRTRRRRRTREETQADLLDAAVRLLRRDGVLAGINLREVAQEAGVNHGQIYQYFGTRQALLRAAIARLIEADRPDQAPHWEQPFTDRRRTMWNWALTQPDLVRLRALLALDDDPELSLFPSLENTRAALERDRRSGALPPDADGEVAHAMTAVTYLGYCIFRHAIARDLGIPADELDRRAADVFDRMLGGLAAGPGADTGRESR